MRIFVAVFLVSRLCRYRYKNLLCLNEKTLCGVLKRYLILWNSTRSSPRAARALPQPPERLRGGDELLGVPPLFVRVPPQRRLLVCARERVRAHAFRPRTEPERGEVPGAGPRRRVLRDAPSAPRRAGLLGARRGVATRPDGVIGGGVSASDATRFRSRWCRSTTGASTTCWARVGA